MAKYYNVVVEESELVDYSVKAESPEQALALYNEGEYIDGYPRDRNVIKIVGVEEAE